MRVERRDPKALTAAELGAWLALAAAAGVPNPFFEPGSVLPAIDCLGLTGVSLIVAIDRAGDWIGLMPFLRRRWRRLMSFAGWWPSAECYLRAPLIPAGREEEVLPALLAESRRGVGLVALDQFPGDGPHAAALESACDALGTRPVVWERYERAALVRRPEADYVELSSRERGDMRRRERRLSDALGAEAKVVDRYGDPEAVEQFLALEGAGWKGRGGTAMAASGGAAFFRAMCAAFAPERRMQMLSLEADGRVAAMQCNLISGDELFGFKTAYDESLARFGPGVQLVARAADAFHERPELNRADSCTAADNEVANRLWPDRRPIVTALVPGEGLAGHAAHTEAGMARALRARRPPGRELSTTSPSRSRRRRSGQRAR